MPKCHKCRCREACYFILPQSITTNPSLPVVPLPGIPSFGNISPKMGPSGILVTITPVTGETFCPSIGGPNFTINISRNGTSLGHPPVVGTPTCKSITIRIPPIAPGPLDISVYQNIGGGAMIGVAFVTFIVIL